MMTISGQLGNNKLSPTLFQNKLTFWLCRVNLFSITSFEQTVSVLLCPKLQPSIKFNTQLQSITIYSTTIRYILKYRIKLGNNKCYVFHGITEYSTRTTFRTTFDRYLVNRQLQSVFSNKLLQKVNLTYL